MDRDQLVMGVSGVFAGLTALLVVVGVAEQPLLLVLAPLFAVTAYLMWYQASGRFAARMRNRDAATDPFGGFTARTRRSGANVGGAGSDRRRRRTRARARFGDRASGVDRSGTTRAEAYRTLGLDPGASDEAVRRAYRSRAKEVHPDADSGDEEAFKRVTRAYERLKQ